MALSGIGAPAEGRVKIKNSFLDDATKKTVDINIEKLTPAEAFETTKLPVTGMNHRTIPRGISFCDSNNLSGDYPGKEALYVQVNGKYKNDTINYIERFALHITHPVCFKSIRPDKTTARDIFIKF